MAKKVSVIIPVYNTEEYIQDCVKSVLQQTFTEFELILIDDGSQDHSGVICEKMCMDDRRIRVIHQEHSGVSAARNAGIDMAEGKYLFFLDSDDLIHPQLLETLYKVQEESQVVLSTVGFYCGQEEEFWQDTGRKMQQDPERDCCYLNCDAAKKPSILLHARLRLGAIGGKMILAEAVRGLRFDEEYTQGEDTLFLYQLIAHGADVIALFRKWYFYRKTEKNHSADYSVQSCKSRFEVRRMLRDHELCQNRTENAAYMEWVLLCEMVLWYEMAKENQDDRLREYVEGLIKTERQSWIYSQVDWCRRILFHLGCTCYPPYRLLADFLSWYHKFLDSPRELRGRLR